ncbi:MAG: PqqD family protein [Armatimonadetes bacterium]|nr:PqqD family protein [Armatimonadota bacterium]
MRLPDLSRLTRRRSREPELSRTEALSARPLRNPVIVWEETEQGHVLLTVPLEVKPWMRLLRLVMQVPTERKVELDELGSDIWRWADGEATVESLVGQLAAAHRLNRREAEVSLTQFLQTLAKRRFLGFALELDDARAQELGASLAKDRVAPTERP